MFARSLTSQRSRMITQKKTPFHWTNPFFLASTWNVSGLRQLFLFLRFSQFFLFHIISKQLLCHLRRPVLFLWVLVFNYFFDVLLGQRLGSKPGSLASFSSDEALQIGRLLSLFFLMPGNWKQLSKPFSRFQLGKFLLKICLKWKIWPISVKRRKPVWTRAWVQKS